MDIEGRGPEPKPLIDKRAAWLIVAAIVVMVFLIVLSPGGDGGSQFTGRAVDRQVESPALLRVDLAIENTGDEAGSPECEVSAYAGATRVGYDILDGEEVAPGDTLRGNMVLTIENESAAAVERVTVTDC